MKKIVLIAKREFLTRVRKRSFIIMTLLGPLLIAGFYALVIYLSINDELSNELKKTIVVDESGIFKGKLKENKFFRLEYSDIPLEAARQRLKNEEGFFGVLYIPPDAAQTLKGYRLISETQTSWKDENYISDKLNQVLRDRKFGEKGIDQALISEINNTSVDLQTVRDTEEGLEKGSQPII